MQMPALGYVEAGLFPVLNNHFHLEPLTTSHRDLCGQLTIYTTTQPKKRYEPLAADKANPS